MPPHANTQAPPSRLPAAPAANPFLAAFRSAVSNQPQVVLDLLIDLVRAARDDQREALVELADDVLGEWVGELVAELTTARRGANVRTSAPAPSDWDHFWSRCPNKVNEVATRAEFNRLPWSDDFRLEFFEGFERWLESASWKRGHVHNPDKWIRLRMWAERPLGADGKPAIGASERRRLAEERNVRSPARLKLLEAVAKMPAPEPQLSVRESYVRRLIAGGPRQPNIETYLRSVGETIPTDAETSRSEAS